MNIENHFRLVAIRAIKPNKLNDDQKKIVSSIQKRTADYDWLYFHAGYSLSDDVENGLYGTKLEVEAHALDDAKMFSYKTDMDINVTAIVGSNGSGKSSTVDLLIRIVNNLGVAWFGEDTNNEVSEHLFFIENLYASLVYAVGEHYHSVTICGRSVKVSNFRIQEDKDVAKVFVQEEPIELLADNEREEGVLIHRDAIDRRQLNDSFYTLIYNYSMYAFNYLDYFSEHTKENRWGEYKVQKFIDTNRYEEVNITTGDDFPVTESAVWLKGLFHKNDGYQVPIVLNPLRSNGNIDIQRENKLAKERLLSMLFYTERIDDLEVGQWMLFPFRIINNTLEIVKIRTKYYEKPNFAKERVLSHLRIDLEADRFETIRNRIISIWAELYNFQVENDTKNKQLAWDYVVYKTLKITLTYEKQYGALFVDLISSDDDAEQSVRNALKTLMADRSHITLKLRRGLYYLKHDVFRSYEEDVNLREVHARALQVMQDPRNMLVIKRSWGLDMHLPDYSELLPPPIFDIDFLLIDRTKIDRDGNFQDKDLFPMSGLSSGEKQVSYSVSNFVYHLVNLESVWDSPSAEMDEHLAGQNQDEDSRIKYRYVNAIFDEVELYFHPDLQRRFVDILISSLQDIHLQHIKGINIVLITHSPFVMSDLPYSNILFLGKKETTEQESFAANIHALLNHGFFMDYSIGEFARKQIEEIMALHKKRMIMTKSVKADWLKNKDRYEYISSIISDRYLKQIVSDMLEDLKWLDEEESLRREIASLNEKLEALQNR